MQWRQMDLSYVHGFPLWERPVFSTLLRSFAELRGVFNLFAARSREEKNALISALDQLVAEKAARESVVVAP